MSVTTEEVNYLIWRYFQETGLETSALALLDETSVALFDEKFGSHVPIGALVNLVQRGILYSEADQLVKPNGDVLDAEEYSEKFSLFHALGADANGFSPPIKNNNTDKNTNNNNNNDDDDDDNDQKMDDQFKTVHEDTQEGEHTDLSQDREGSADAFIKVLEKTHSFEPITCADWNPSQPQVLSMGLSEARARISVLLGDNDVNSVNLGHPQLLASLSSHDSSNPDITAVAWSPNGSLLLTAVQTGELRLWSAEGKLRNVMTLHHAAIVMIRWSNNGEFILTTDAENNTIVWDSTTGSVVQQIDLKADSTSNVVNPIISPSTASSMQPSVSSSNINETPITTTTTTTTTTSTLTQQVIYPLGTDSTWMDDSKFIIPGLNGSALVFNIRNRQPMGTLIGHTKPLSMIKFNKDKSLLLTASDDRSIRIWNGVSFNNSQILLGHSQAITYAEWMDDDNHIVSCSLDSSIRIWEVKTRKQISINLLDGLPITMACLSFNKSMIVTGTSDGGISVFQIIKRQNSSFKLKEIAEYQPNVSQEDLSHNFVTSLQWSCSDELIIVGYSHCESAVLRIPKSTQ